MVFSLVLALALADSPAAPEAPASQAGGATAPTAAPRLFLQCPQDCWADFLRQELNHFDFVRDLALADVAVLVVRQPLGAGAEQISVTTRAGERETSHTVSVAASATDVERRDDVAQAILRLLYDSLRDTPHAAAFTFGLPQRSAEALGDVADPWRFWTISLEAQGEVWGGRSYHEGFFGGGVAARHLTPRRKVLLTGWYWRNLARYRLEDGSVVRASIPEWDARALWAEALGERWSIGATATAGGGAFANLDLHLHGGLLVEHNFVPYSENARRQLRLIYQIGPWANWYVEPNVDGDARGIYGYHALSFVADVNLHAGSVQWIAQVNHFLSDPELFRVSTGAVVGLRLAKGLMLTVEGEGAYVADFVNLRGRPVTDEELLLGTVQQPTDFTFEVLYGLTYTFGSRHATTVNPRFGRVDLSDE